MAFLKSALRYLGYTAWFFAALVTFIYLTLPLEQLESYLVRKAADEYNADLDIVELSTWGLLGLEATGVTLTPRPTPEQVAEIEAAREKLAAWEAAEAARKEAEAAAAAAPKAPAPTADAKPGDPAAALANAKKRAKKAKTAAAEPRPKVPAPPAPVLLNVLRLGVSPWAPWALATGAFEGRFEAELLDGSIEADVARGDEAVRVAARWSGLDLTRVSVLREALPLPLAGTMEGEIDLEIPADDNGKPKLTAILGHIDLKLGGAELGPGRVPAKLGAFQFFDAPKTRLGDVGGRLAFDPGRRRATLENFSFSGKDAEGEITGFIQLASTLKRWGPRLHLRIKLNDDFVKANSLSALLAARKVKRGMDADGFLGLSMTGMLAKPSFRLQKRSPYVKKARSKKAKKARGKLRDRKPRTRKPLDRASKRKSARKPPKKPPKPVKPRVTRRDKRARAKSAARAKLGSSTSGASDDDIEDDDDEEDLDQEAEEEAREEEEERADEEEDEDEAGEDGDEGATGGDGGDEGEKKEGTGDDEGEEEE